MERGLKEPSSIALIKAVKNRAMFASHPAHSRLVFKVGMNGNIADKIFDSFFNFMVGFKWMLL